MMKRILLLLILTITLKFASAQIFVNEIMARNDFNIADEFGELDDWIELYNSSNMDIDLAGGYITDDIGNPTLHQIESGFPDLTTVPANGYLIFWADGSPDQGANHLGFSLSSGGESVALVLSDGETVVNAVQFGDQENDISYGRSSDGSIELQYFSIPTPNATNQVITPQNEVIHINELMSENVETIADESGLFEPWLELYNPNDYQVNLAGYSLDFNNGEAVYEIPNSDPNATVIEANNFKLFWCDNQSIEGVRHTNFILNDESFIRLLGPDGGVVVDEINFSSSGESLSYGSSLDGGSEYISFSTPTPDVTNELVIVLPELLYINEVMSSNLSDTLDSFGESEDWIEIYNPNSYDVNLSGYYLTDDLGGGSWRIPDTYPDSVTVAAQNFILFWADNDEEQGVRHANFKLASAGEGLALLSSDNFSQADFIDLPLMSEDVSFGREEDGSTNWVYFTPQETTPEYSNHGAVGVNELVSEVYRVFPNPVNEILFTEERIYSLLIKDASGKEISMDYMLNSVNVSSLASGVYFLQVNNGLVQRIVKL